MVQVPLTDNCWPVLYFETGDDSLFYRRAVAPLFSQAGSNYWSEVNKTQEL